MIIGNDRSPVRAVKIAHAMVCPLLFIPIVSFLSARLFHFNVKLYAAEQHAGEFPRDRFVRALTVLGEPSRQGALNEIEKHFLSEPAAAEVLIHALKHADLSTEPRISTLRIIWILGELDHPCITDALVSALASPNLRTVMFTVDTLGRRGDEEAVQAIAKLYEREEFATRYGFRKCLLHAMMQISGQHAVDLMMKQLLTIDGPLRRDIVHYLRHICGKPFGQATEVWEQWWSAERDQFQFAGIRKWEPPTAVELANLLQDPAFSRYYQFDIYAKRLVFVIDRSSSMNKLTGNGTRLHQAKRELIRAIAALPQSVSFNMIFFDKDVASWQAKLVPATQANQERAIRFVSRMKPGKGTASYDGLKRALELDGNTEEIFFLSDGQPRNGKYVLPADIIRAITRENFFHRVSINTLSVDARGDAARFLAELAELNNGACVIVAQ